MIISAVLLTGCAEIRLASNMSSKLLLQIDDEQCATAEAVMRLMEVKRDYQTEGDDMFWYRTVGDETIEDYIKESVKDEMLRITAAVLMADEMAIYLDEEEQKEVRKTAQDAYDSLVSDFDLSKYGITLETAISLYTKIAFYNKVFNKLSENIKIEISESDTKVIEVNYVLLPLSVNINQAEDLRNEIRTGTSFERACTALGYEPVMNAVLMKGEMPASFESAAYSLLDGELSETIETAEGLYLIQCVEDYMIIESVANNNRVVSNSRKKAFDDRYVEFSSKKLLRFNTAAWDAISVVDL